jgi:hypothetical protein
MMKTAGIIVFVVGCIIGLVPGVWSWLFIGEGEPGTSVLWERYFIWTQMMLAGLSLMRHPKPITTVIVIAVTTALMLVALSQGYFYLAIGLLLVQAAITWQLHGKQVQQERASE